MTTTPGPSTPGPAGPVEWIAITFAGGALDPGVVPPLAALVDTGTVRVLDAAVVHKAPDGTVTGAELDEEGPDIRAGFEGVDGEILQVLSDGDLRGIAESLRPDTTTLVLVWENRWAGAFAEQVRRAGGTVLAHDRIPPEDVERALRAADPEGVHA
ncbi:DUF6325 family protein [Pseudonocardia lacus]|uniref:DUF6325 family protein n=1 Tax=Pseudonocardia lacus TaxID=2835865 RepID=UPI001BDC7FA9|nr:DUF6325 family protein [Pseudonocardia lacus]